LRNIKINSARGRGAFSVAFPTHETYNAIDPASLKEEAMKTTKFHLLAASAILFVVLALAGCESKVKVANTDPGNLTLSVSKCFIEKGGTITCSGSATDDDGDPLTFKWTATAGTFTPASGEGASVQWTAPNSPASVTITMAVTDEIVTVKKAQAVTVCVPVQSSIIADVTIENTGAVYIVKNSNLLPISSVATLTIEAGVTIVFDSPASGFLAEGRIVAEGTSSEKIRFRGNTCGSSSGLWDGIYIAASFGRASFRHVELTASSNGIQMDGGAQIALVESAIYGNSNIGISIVGELTMATIRGCDIWDNGTGVEISNAKVDISGTSISYNIANGVEVAYSLDETYVTIDSSTVADNGNDGFLLSNLAAPAIHYCTISANGEESGYGYAIRLAGYAGGDTIHAEHNFWGVGNTTEQKIGLVIYDGKDAPGLPYVGIAPWLTESPVGLAAAPAAPGASSFAGPKERQWAR
jgi:hypothetical protein